MPKTFYDNDGNELGVFYTKAEADILLNAKQNKLYIHQITIDSIGEYSDIFNINVISSNSLSISDGSFNDFLNLLQPHSLISCKFNDEDTGVAYSATIEKYSNGFTVFYGSGYSRNYSSFAEYTSIDDTVLQL